MSAIEYTSANHHPARLITRSTSGFIGQSLVQPNQTERKIKSSMIRIFTVFWYFNGSPISRVVVTFIGFYFDLGLNAELGLGVPRVGFSTGYDA